MSRHKKLLIVKSIELHILLQRTLTFPTLETDSAREKNNYSIEKKNIDEDSVHRHTAVQPRCGGARHVGARS